MDEIPEELILHIACFLEALDILQLSLTSHKFYKIVRDNELWRQLCIRDSHFPSRSSRHREGRYGGPMPIPEPSVFALQRALSQATGKRNGSDQDPLKPSTDSRSRSASLNGEQSHPVDWHNEYIARYAPLCVGWLSTPQAADGSDLDIHGIGLYEDSGRQLLISPLDDGSVCLWDVGDQNRPGYRFAGEIRTKSKPSTYEVLNSNGQLGTTVVQGISIDSIRQKAYVAGGPYLTEIDLNTFQSSVVFQARQASRDTGLSNRLDNICVLSDGGASPNPLTVGSTTALHMFDHRLNNDRRSAQTMADIDAGLGSLQDPDGFPVGKSKRRISMSDLRQGWAILDPLPLSILHQSDLIHVGGRFPFILSYDRRTFPRLASTIYSGARISALADLSSSSPLGPIVAAGEYKGKGSIEIYPPPSVSDASAALPLRNRTSASRSKLLSVVPHGNRIMFSDSDGQLKWVERDGYTLVRRWNINEMSVSPNSQRTRGIFHISPESSDVARKLLPLGSSEKSEVCVWTGEKVGVLNFGTKPRIGSLRAADASPSEAESEGDDRRLDMQRIRFERMMRRALERQADEARLVPQFGR